MTRKRTPLAPSTNPVSRKTRTRNATVCQPPTAPTATESQAPQLDAHGFDPSEYKWLPVR